MAQIRKFQPGGKTSNKIGVLTIDGKEYTGDGFIQHMRDYRKTLDDKVADQFGNIINALEAGENLQYDSDSDILTGNVNWNVSKLQEKRLDKGTDRTKIGQVFGALNEGKEQRVRYAINALRGMEPYEDPNNKIVKEEHDPKVFDWSNSIELDYTVKDGKKHVTKMDNAHVIDRLNQLKAVLSDKWAEDDNFTGWNGYTRDHYRNAYLEHSDSLPEIIKRINEGAWTDDDLSILKDIGVVDKQKKDIDTNIKKGTTHTSTATIPPYVATAPQDNSSAPSSDIESMNELSKIYDLKYNNEAVGRIYMPSENDASAYLTWLKDDQNKGLDLIYQADIPISNDLAKKLVNNIQLQKYLFKDKAFRKKLFNRIQAPYYSALKNKFYDELDDAELEGYGLAISDFDNVNAWNTGYKDRMINIRKHKDGGEVIGAKDGVQTSAININVPYDDGEHAKVLTPQGNDFDKFTSADWAELVSTALTLTSAASGAATGGGNIASGIIGAIGDIVQFGSDIARDGFDGKDLAYLGGNLALSAATAFPIVGYIGDSGKMAKVANSVRKFYNVLEKGLLVGGAINAVPSLKNIADGKATMEDVKNVATGLQALTGLKNIRNRTKFISKNTKPTISKDLDKNIQFDTHVKQLEDKDAFYKKVIDKRIAENSSLMKHNNSFNDWAPNGTVTNYEKAFWDLRKSGHISNEHINGALPIKQRLSIKSENLKDRERKMWSKSYEFLTGDSESLKDRKFTVPTNELRKNDMYKKYLNWQKEDFVKALRKSSYKHGGVIKGHDGITDAIWNYDYENPNEKWYTIDTISQWNPISVISTSTKTSKASRQNAGEAPPKWKQNLKDYASRAFNYENLNTLGQVVGSIAANHKVAKIKENLIKNTPIARNVFQMTVPKYYENTRGFDERKRAILNTVLPTTSDAALNAKMKMNLLSEANKVDREKYDYLSKNIGEYLNNINTISNKNRELRVAESNNFLERLGQRNAALAENEIGKITNDYQTGIQLAKKSLYDFRNDQAQFNALQAQQQFLTKANEYQDAAKKYVKSHPMNQDAINTYGSDYLSYYLANNETAKNNYAKDRLQMQFDQYNLGRSSIFSPRFKSGGKLSAKDHIKINKAKTQNQMLLNQHKEVMKAVQKLNDDVFKIFLKMIK